MKGILLILASVAIGAAGQLCLKKGMMDFAARFGATSATAIWGQLLHVVLIPMIVLGFLAYLVSGILWLVVLQQFEVNFALPWQALTYVIVLLAAKMIFGENLNAWRLLGVALICVGVIAVARGK
jgi:drug/metabolite transporter (DMT)-like permease